METNRSGHEINERYRSWGETQIGRMLGHYGIAHRHEPPVAIIDRGQVRIWYPDFVLNTLLIEYCGRLQDPDYAAGVARKNAVYSQNGMDVITVTPEDLHGQWPDQLLDRIESALQKQLSGFQDARKIR